MSPNITWPIRGVKLVGRKGRGEAEMKFAKKKKKKKREGKREQAITIELYVCGSESTGHRKEYNYERHQ